MKPTIGIEVHVELKSRAKVFSDSKNNFNDEPNTNINVIDLGYPGTLPKLNKEVINMALKACLAFNCDINKTMHFDRKNYFYPDLPKGYQITQNQTPIGFNGYVPILVDGENKNIELERIHIEEDTCKSIHADVTLLNFNRAGVPLIEIVTKPVITNGKEAVAYLEKLRQTLLYLGISDVKMEEGSMRCDVNVSVSDNDKLGTKCEVKNMGSISAVGIAVDYEINRQKELIAKGEKIIEQTRRYDEKTKSTVLMRVKETGNDYRYFPEPDIPFVYLTDEWIEDIKKELPVLTDELKLKYESLGINKQNVKTIINNKDLCDFMELAINNKVNPVIASNLLTGDISSYLNKNFGTIKSTKLTVTNFSKLVLKIETKEISSKQAKDIIPILLETGDSIENIIKDLKIERVDDNLILDIIKKVLETNPDAIKDHKEGKDRAVKYLMGQIMKESKGGADPIIANKMLNEQLSKY